MLSKCNFWFVFNKRVQDYKTLSFRKMLLLHGLSNLIFTKDAFCPVKKAAIRDFDLYLLSLIKENQLEGFLSPSHFIVHKLFIVKRFCICIHLWFDMKNFPLKIGFGFQQTLNFNAWEANMFWGVIYNLRGKG